MSLEIGDHTCGSGKADMAHDFSADCFRTPQTRRMLLLPLTSK